ncbi:uncharacterized protein BCR38DRAFT_444266 [Pseudomassariella vexata]|uniref:Uncharacterized protein n=1 Tax=Pseudomassariella vexata TaxID=1141098 RepID=A0A1Y2DLM3_9PEZI|nr:uncharacterized protein BCR38DRAFT_444266 [Pseudomassariella vexata]ORY60208.1 hypothetical protein BCR38DRAFT_444266 [Pseudomassariella vexata]
MPKTTETLRGIRNGTDEPMVDLKHNGAQDDDDRELQLPAAKRRKSTDERTRVSRACDRCKS